MDEHSGGGGCRLERWPDVEPWAESLFKALQPTLGPPTRTGWGSARFRECEVRLELSYPGPRMSIRVIDAVPDTDNVCYHTYSWEMGALRDVDRNLAIERALMMAEQLRVDAQKRDFG